MLLLDPLPLQLHPSLQKLDGCLKEIFRKNCKTCAKTVCHFASAQIRRIKNRSIRLDALHCHLHIIVVLQYSRLLADLRHPPSPRVSVSSSHRLRASQPPFPCLDPAGPASTIVLVRCHRVTMGEDVFLSASHRLPRRDEFVAVPRFWEETPGESRRRPPLGGAYLTAFPVHSADLSAKTRLAQIDQSPCVAHLPPRDEQPTTGLPTCLFKQALPFRFLLLDFPPFIIGCCEHIYCIQFCSGAITFSCCYYAS